MIPLVALLVTAMATAIGALGALFLKRGAHHFSFRPAKLLRNRQLVAGALLYAASVPLYLYALKVLPLAVAYPLTSMTYVWSALLARRHLNEQIRIGRWCGILLIVAGIVVISV